MSKAGPTAAYLYVLSLDPAARAWEYLRRNADYRTDWRRHIRVSPDPDESTVRRAEPWGLRFPGGPDARRPLGGACLAA